MWYWRGDMLLAVLTDLPIPMVLIIFPYGVCAAIFTTGYFLEASNSETNVEVYRTYSEPTGKCGLICLRNVVSVPSCVAYRYEVPEMTCELYKDGGTDNAASPGIPLFWFQVTDVFQTVSVKGNLYSVYLSSVKKSFMDARIYCQSLGGYLLQFDSLDEHEAVKLLSDRLTPRYYFVGANDLDTEGRWVTDKEGTDLDLTTWIWWVGEPNNAGGIEDCAVFVGGRNALYDVPCSRTESFLCERDL